MKVDEELQKIFGSVLALMDKDRVPSANTGELKVFASRVRATITDTLLSLPPAMPGARPPRTSVRRIPKQRRSTRKIGS